MNLEESIYVVRYFPRLMTEMEKAANRHYYFSSQLGKPSGYENLEDYERKKAFFEKWNGIAKDGGILKLLENGYERFVLGVAERIQRETPDQYSINRCPKCAFIARTPYAKQCRKCGHDWHDEIMGQLRYAGNFKLTGRQWLWIFGELVGGEVGVGARVDLTNFQLNIVAEIKQIEFVDKVEDGVRKGHLALGIQINGSEEALIGEYLKKHHKIMILRPL